MNRNKRWNKKTAGKILIVTGSFIIVFVIVINIIDLVKSAKAINDFKKSQAHIIVERIDDSGNVISQHESEIVSKKLDYIGEPDEKPDEKIDEEVDEITDEETGAETDEKVPMCLLRIPKINLEEAVREGSTRGVLSSALGHIENTALPGEDGNCCIAGHRNYVFGKYFNRLDEVALGDVIELKTRDNLYEYEVVSIEVVEPEEVRVLDYAEGNNLTLITCTPFMVGTHRLIVHAIMK